MSLESPEVYSWLKAAHLMAVMAWVAGMAQLSALFTYHAMAPMGSDHSALLKVMERRLVRVVLHPALAGMIVTGAVLMPDWLAAQWLWVKGGLVGVLVGCHVVYASWFHLFAADRNRRTHVYYRVMGLLIGVTTAAVIVLSVLKPF
ncbi:MAG: CopD family protein [Alphaproteobacteria bacterium]